MIMYNDTTIIKYKFTNYLSHISHIILKTYNINIKQKHTLKFTLLQNKMYKNNGYFS